MSTPAPILPQAAGYGVVLGIGFFFAAFMALLAHLQNRYTHYSTRTSEEFNTASRSVKPGLIASGIVSAWTWALTVAQVQLFSVRDMPQGEERPSESCPESSTVAYEYGVAGPFWYAAGATVQILVFSILAVKVKQNAPRCHTYLEIIHTRYGPGAHLVFIFFAIFTNILVGSQMLLGGSAVVAYLTGMDTYAAVWLIPVGVAIYVVLGGLRATFLCDYTHTVILMIIILYFIFTVYASSPLIGSFSSMYALLQRAAAQRPVQGNEAGSYLTLKSNSALQFGVIQLCSGSGTVFLDQGYWQRAIASRPTTAVRAYLLGGLAWFAIPFAFATTLGLAAVALSDSPAFPTYPSPLSADQISAGLAAPSAATALLGKQGAAALLIVLFMAVTSASSAELIATSSILTFDIYKLHLNPAATPGQLIRVSHAMIVLFAVVMAVFASIWQAAGISLGWLFLFMGVVIGGAVVPVANTICWKKQTRAAAVTGAVVGCLAGIFAWLLVARLTGRTLSVATTGTESATLAGCVASICVGGICTLAISLWKPDDFDWEITRAINPAPEHGAIDPATPAPVSSRAAREEELQEDIERERERAEKSKDHDGTRTAAAEVPEPAAHAPLPGLHFSPAEDPHSPALKQALKFAIIASLALVAVLDIIIPMPMFFTHYLFSYRFFTAWVVISIIWTFCSALITIIMPLWESSEALLDVSGGFVRDVFLGGKGSKKRRMEEREKAAHEERAHQ
ncbi:Na+/solute symporter [Calocera cornea HHB12733]|uniref:Na+/solute symporter n=1 Tax=Calocera cornea HHB12733 TaxID=1353952 RepID=A0A165CWR8_9BASI|nr:Na+/solute symporter [Calocera cornea HHB12733]